MTLTIRFFGVEILALDFNRGKAEKAEEAPRMEAGSGHNFERDLAPPNPSGEEPYFDGRFGFRGVS